MGGGERLTGRRGPLGRRLEYTDNHRTNHCCGPAFDSIPRPNLRADRQEPPDFSVPRLAGYLLFT